MSDAIVPAVIVSAVQPKRRLTDGQKQFLVFVAFLLLWEIAGRFSNPLYLAPASEIVRAFVAALTDPKAKLAHATLETLSLLVPGFLFAAVFGVLIGLIMGRREMVCHFLEPYVLIFYNTPRVVLIPILMVWIGTGDLMKITVVIITAIFPIIMNTMIGVRDVSSQLTEPAKSMNATERQMLFKVILPGALPFVTTGIRLGVGRAVTTVVVAEIFVSISGLGGLLHSAGMTLNMANMFVPAIVLGLIGGGVEAVLGRIERSFSVRYGL
jgi:ABC-type nitrate/sulfonate/bicarbonate transport system permease component